VATRLLRKPGLTTVAAVAKRRAAPRYGRATLQGTEAMAQDNSVGILTGLIFVALFLLMIASMQGLPRFMGAPPGAYDLAGSSRPAK
jgi:hypothetical protein